MANPIYAVVVPRELTLAAQEGLVQDVAWYVNEDGSLDLSRLLGAFQELFREHSEHWIPRFDYREFGPHLLLPAFLQRIVNGGGRIEREYGLDRGRTDLLVVWPRSGGERFVIECRILRGTLECTIRKGLEQTAACMDRCAAEEGHLVIFDRSEDRAWRDSIFRRDESEPSNLRARSDSSAGEAPITVLGNVTRSLAPTPAPTRRDWTVESVFPELLPGGDSGSDPRHWDACWRPPPDRGDVYAAPRHVTREHVTREPGVRSGS